MGKPRFRFRDSDHTYWLGKELLPNVTTILQPDKPTFYKPGSAERGKDVHTICQYHDEGTLDYTTIDPSYQGYYESYLKMLNTFYPKWQLIERRLYHPELHYAGTLDRMGEMLGGIWIVDLKTGAVVREIHGPQLAAYVMMGEPECYHTIRRACWHLKKDGGMGSHVEYNDAGDFLLFRQKLDQWREQNGKREGADAV